MLLRMHTALRSARFVLALVTTAVAVTAGACAAPSSDDAASASAAVSSCRSDAPAPAEDAGPVPSTLVSVHSLLPESEATTLQAIFDRLGIRPMACSSQATIAAPSPWSDAWAVTGSDVASGASLTASEATALAAIFARLEVAPNQGVEFVRHDHTECYPNDGKNEWRVQYSQ